MIDLSPPWEDYRLKLIAAQKRLRVSNETLAERTGAHPTTISRLRSGKLPIDDQWRAKLAAGLGKTVHDVFSDEALALPSEAPNPASNRVAAPAPAPHRDLPVRGTAAAAHLRGAFLIEPKTAVDMVWRPPSLAGAPDAYAFYCEGDSMMPEFRHGEIYVAHPGRKARPGDNVIVQTRVAANRPVEATLGRLVQHTPERLQIRKRNPESTVEIEIGTVLAVHKVLTNNELFGV